MGPLVVINVALVGFMAFAALHYSYLWWLSRRERVLLVFALFSLQVAAESAGVARMLMATSISQVQNAVNVRTSVGILMLPVMTWLVSQISGVPARRFIIFIAIVIFMPQGLLGFARRWLNR